MARKAKKKVEKPPPANDDDVTEEESLHGEDGGDVQMNSDSDDDIPDIIDKDSGDEDDEAAAAAAEEPKKATTSGDDKKSKKKDKKAKSKKSEQPKKMIPFMDTFYQLSSEDSSQDRSIAARDLIHHCFLTEDEEGVNYKDAAYALTRLMNGLCTGRAASRQGFASCLSSFLRVAYSPSLNEGGNSSSSVMEGILKEDEYAKQLKGDDDAAMIIRQKLLSTTQFLAESEGNNKKGKKGQKKGHCGGKMKGIEERDHAFGRLFGILAVVRSGILNIKDFPSEVVEGYTNDLIDLYNYKPWMKEPSANAIMELLESLDAQSNPDLIAKVTNNVITPTFFLPMGKKDDRASWLKTLTPEQIAVGLHLQQSKNDSIKYDYPLNEPLITAESVPALSEALASTSSVVHPRCHVVWNSLWMYLTEESKTQGYRQLRSSEEFPAIIEKIIEHVVLGMLLQSAGPTNERRSLALQIVCALCGSSNLKMVLPSNLIGKILCPEVVTRVFINVICASGGKKKSKEGAEHNLKPLTSKALVDLINDCCESTDVDRRMAFIKAFLLTDPRFDAKTKTQTVSSLLMIKNDGTETSDVNEVQRITLCQQYLSFLEEKIVSATNLHNATVYIELMYKFAKQDLNNGPADEARRVIRFFMSGAFFDCTDLSDPPGTKTPSKKKKKGKAKSTTSNPPQELSSGLRIKEILEANDLASISQPARVIMSARFYSLLSDFISVINLQHRGGSKSKEKGSKPESIYRALSEISGICSLLETSGAKKFPASSEGMDSDDASDAEDPMEASTQSMLRVQKIANDALVKECDGSDDKDTLRAKAVFATSSTTLMISLHLMLNSCGKPEVGDNEEEEEDEEVVESVHEYISDLSDCVESFCTLIDGGSSSDSYEKNDDQENPLAMMAGLLVNILSSPVGGGESGMATNPSASKLIREAVKLAWSGTISAMNCLAAKNKSLTNLVDEDVMSILIESVCGEKAMGDGEKEKDDESVDVSESSEDGLGDSAVFVNASDAGMDLEEPENGSSSDSKENDDDSSKGSEDANDEEDVELDPAKLENLLLEDSDAEMSESGVLEHHAGADKALAQLIKLKQEARKASQTERERIELCNRLRCAGLLDSLFSPTVFKSGWLPVGAVLGSIAPILRARRAIAKGIHASSSSSAQKSLSEKNALLDRLSVLVKDKISKFRCSNDSSPEELALKASTDIYEETKLSLNAAHCSCCSVALVTAVRCIPNMEACDEVKDIYIEAINDWSSRKATKIHSSVFDDLIKRMPSLASVILVGPLTKAVKNAHSPFLKCESIKLLSAIYKHDATTSEQEDLSQKAKSTVQDYSSEVSETLKDALDDSSLKKAKHRDEVLTATKHFINYVKTHNDGILTDSELCSLQETIKSVEAKCESAGMKQLCSQVSEAISALPRQDNEKKPKRSKAPKTPKTNKKPKKSKK